MHIGPEASGQMPLPLSDTVSALNHFADAGVEERGAVFTRGEVAEFILDLVGYTTDRPLHQCRVLEPSFGEGDFLVPAVKRLLSVYTALGRGDVVPDLSDAIRAIEVHTPSIEATRETLVELFQSHEFAAEDALEVVSNWLIQGDFLLVDLPHSFTHSIGNPPYLRQELIPDVLMAQYRARYMTIYDRADLYVPFIERCLTLLGDSGVLGFICSDRWMKNKYGGPLRRLVAEKYHLTAYVDMVDTPAFHSDVIAYPAITIVTKESPGPTRVAHRPSIDAVTLRQISEDVRSKVIPPGSQVQEVVGVTSGAQPWIFESPKRMAVLRRLEADFPTVEDAGCRVGIGVATGADKVFIGAFSDLEVESDRKLPLVMTTDIEDGTVQWQGMGVINPFRDDGGLVDLGEYPMLRSYLQGFEEIVRKRNVAVKNPNTWYRTIDRIYPALANAPKLLIPDIKGEAHIVLEEGRLYPHHNLYFITSDEWDLKALQTVLRSGIAKLFVSMYSTQMRGGYLRFQAQYLRRIRLPRWEAVPEAVRDALVRASDSGDGSACKRAVAKLYGLTPAEEIEVFQTGKGLSE